MIGGGDTATVRAPSYLVAVQKVVSWSFFTACLPVVFFQILNQISGGVFGSSLNGRFIDEVDSATREHPNGIPLSRYKANGTDRRKFCETLGIDQIQTNRYHPLETCTYSQFLPRLIPTKEPILNPPFSSPCGGLQKVRHWRQGTNLVPCQSERGRPAVCSSGHSLQHWWWGFIGTAWGKGEGFFVKWVRIWVCWKSKGGIDTNLKCEGVWFVENEYFVGIILIHSLECRLLLETWGNQRFWDWRFLNSSKVDRRPLRTKQFGSFEFMPTWSIFLFEMVFFASSSSYLGFWKTCGMPLFPSNKSQEKTIRGSTSFRDFKNSQDFWGYSQILRHTPTQWVTRCYRVLLLWMMRLLVQVGGWLSLLGIAVMR